MYGNKIRLPITEVLLCAASGDLARFKKAAVLEAAECRPPHVISNLCLNTQQGVIRGGAPEDFRFLHHEESVGGGR